MSLPASDYLDEIRLIDLDENLSDEDEPETPCPGHLDQVGVDPDGFAKCQRCGMEWGGCRGYDEAIVPPHNELQPWQSQESGAARASSRPPLDIRNGFTIHLSSAAGSRTPPAVTSPSCGEAPAKLRGMTRGARKRAALWSVFVPWCIKEYGFDPGQESSPPAERRHMRGCLPNSELRAAYQLERLRWGLRGRGAKPLVISVSVEGMDEIRRAACHAAEHLARQEHSVFAHPPSSLINWSPRKLLRGEQLSDLLPAWLAKQIGLPSAPAVATLLNLVEHRAHGVPLKVLVGDKIFPAALLLAALNLFEDYLAPKEPGRPSPPSQACTCRMRANRLQAHRRDCPDHSSEDSAWVAKTLSPTGVP